MVPGVEPAEREIRCPRCSYNLRALTQPRCPECGLAFSAADWASGVLREHVPSLLDRVDLWRPDLVLLASLGELARGALRPRWLFRKLDLQRPCAPALVMLAAGTLWVYVLAAGALAAAAALHEQVSPRAALRWALVEAGPRVVALGVLQAGLALGLIVDRRFLHVRQVTSRHVLRLAGHWLPAGAAWLVVPLVATTLVWPAVALSGAPLWAALPLLPFVAVPVAGRRQPAGLGRAVVVLGMLAAFAAVVSASPGILPDSLEPGMWVYF